MARYYGEGGSSTVSQYSLLSKKPLDRRYVIESQDSLQDMINKEALYDGLEFSLLVEATVDAVTLKPGVYIVRHASANDETHVFSISDIQQLYSYESNEFRKTTGDWSQYSDGSNLIFKYNGT